MADEEVYLTVEEINPVAKPPILPTRIDGDGGLFIKHLRDYFNRLSTTVDQIISVLKGYRKAIDDVEDTVENIESSLTNTILSNVVITLPDPATPIWNITVTQPANGRIEVNGQIGTQFSFPAGTQVKVEAFANTNYSVTTLWEDS